MDFFTSFLLSVGASVVAYYICKWLDSNFNSQPMKKPSKSVASRVSFCPMDYLHHFAYNYCSTHFCAFQVYAEK